MAGCDLSSSAVVPTLGAKLSNVSTQQSVILSKEKDRAKRLYPSIKPPCTSSEHVAHNSSFMFVTTEMTTTTTTMFSGFVAEWGESV